MLSIMPPGEAFAFAQNIRTVLAASPLAGLALPCAFVDCNAVNPETVRRIGGLFRETPVGFIRAGIVRTPPREGRDPNFHACTESGSEQVLEEFAVLFQYGLKISLLKGAGAGIGDASSLKLCESVSDSFLQHGIAGLKLKAGGGDR
jgi:hypothetical protein